MYLALLNENEKAAFLGMAYNLVIVDGDYSDAENAVMNGYCQELQFTFDENTMIKPMETLIQFVKDNSNDNIKKIFIFELIGLAMADSNYDNDERKVISQMMSEYNIDADYAKNCESILNEYIEFQGKINKLVLG